MITAESFETLADWPEASLIALDEVVDSVFQGRALFFAGSGLSIDNEGTTGFLLMGTLLVRLAALHHGLCDGAAPPDTGKAQVTITGLIRQLEDVLLHGDGSHKSSPAELVSPANIRALADQYFETNEWFANAFGDLVQVLDPVPPDALQELSGRVLREEGRLVAELRDENVKRTGAPGTVADPEPLDLRVYVGFARALEAAGPGEGPPYATAGKALFLDTLGFAGRRIMCGDPLHDDLHLARASYAAPGGGERLLERQHVLGRLALEGFLPVLVTTNFDTLLEGACRLNGFGRPERGQNGRPPLHVIPDRRAFFTHGAGPNGIRVLKIHGCVRRYGKCREEVARPMAEACSLDKADITDADKERARRFRHDIAAIVYTYREILHWRDDAWSRDLLRSLIRTHDMVFVGYSARDPVIHDTFRSIYEEMARSGPTEDEARATRAFFFDAVPDPEAAPALPPRMTLAAVAQ